MKQKHIFLPLILIVFFAAFFLFQVESSIDKDAEYLRAQHKIALENSPFKTTKNLSKAERKAMALPPNAYNEQLWELTLDPQTGRPMPERVLALQEELKIQRQTRGVGGDSNNPWIDRGPNNIGGRTRGIMFDPNDVGGGNGDGIDYNRVFAGGVSGGLWVNNDITNASSSWTLVPGIGANISVTVIISDPNNSNIFYIGSGESYTSGAATGRGIWKSTDAGVTWTNIFGGYTGVSGGGQLVDGIFYVNDLVARNNGGVTELYAAIAGAFNGNSDSPNQWNGLNEQGLYFSNNAGTSWQQFIINESNGSPSNPNDIELDINNNVWLSTTSSSWGFPGGKILRSTNTGAFNANSFSLINTITGANRTEIEPSATNANNFWVAANVSGAANLYVTTNAFTSYVAIGEPSDADPNIGPTDYTRGQAFYDLPIEIDASDNLMVGGIDLFRLPFGGSWGQISEWYNIGGLTASFVHADQHAIVQRPGVGNSDKYVFGTDGGVYYCDDITTALNNASAISARNQDYNTIQFYYGAIDPSTAGGDDMTGGTQDNGTPFIMNASAGPNAFTELVGGDGGFTDIDGTGANQYMIQSYTGNYHRYINWPTYSQVWQVSTNTNGDGNFINEAELDKNLDILYSNATFLTGTPQAPIINSRIERSSNFAAGPGGILNVDLQDPLLDDYPSAMKISPYTTASSKLYVGLRNGALIRIDNADGGVAPSYTSITGPGFAGSISDIEFGANENEIYVTFHNYGVTSIWYTSNGGTTWVNKEGNLPDLPVKCILQNPLLPNEVIIGTELGVWATADFSVASPVWIQTYNGMSDVTVVDLDLRAADDVILASTHGRGMFTSQFTSTTLSVAETSFNNKTIKIYPTVSDGNFTLETQRALGTVNFELYDLTGQKIYNSSFEFNSNKKEFNLNLSTGMYLAKITSENSAVTKRIIIK